MPSNYEVKSVMGKAFGVAGIFISPAFALMKGCANAIQGREFFEGTMDVLDTTVDKAAEFGDKHGGEIVSRLLTGILIGFGADLTHHSHDHDA
jgi:hypothetical protein